MERERYHKKGITMSMHRIKTPFGTSLHLSWEVLGDKMVQTVVWCQRATLDRYQGSGEARESRLITGVAGSWLEKVLVRRFSDH